MSEHFQNIIEKSWKDAKSIPQTHKKYNTMATVPKFKLKIVERDKVDTDNKYIHDRSLSWLSTVTSIKKKSVGIRLVLNLSS
jgi:hypothetical protein